MSTEDLNQLIESAPTPKPSIPSKKRKRTADKPSKTPKSSTTTTTTSTSTPKTKKPKTKKAKLAAEDEDLDLTNNLNLSISKMDPQLLSDYTAQKTRKFEGDLSAIELADKYIPAVGIKDTSSFEKLRTDENLPGFLERFAGCGDKKLWGSSKKVGSPHTIVVAGGGLRAADLTRVLRSFSTKDAIVAKLFAKHIKIADQINFLKNTRTGIAVGTPQRLEDLMDDGALNTSRLERIIIDASHIDIKKQGILEMKDTQISLMKLLARKEFRERLGGDVGVEKKDDVPSLEIMFY